MRRQLEPLLKIALSIQEPPPVEPAEDFRIRARVRLMNDIHAERNEKRSWIAALNSGIRHSWYSGWLKTATAIIAIILVSSILGTGIVYASADTLPGDTLYSVKIGAEQARKLFTVNDIARIELELKSADMRLEEIEALANKSPERMTLAVKGYEKNIVTATEKAESNKGVSTEGMETVALATLEQVSILDRISDDIKADEKEPVRQAEEIAFRAQFEVQRSLAEKDPLRATEMNIIAMQNRLNRAGDKADEGEIGEAEYALRQFMEMFKFGEEISEIAGRYGYSTAAINALNVQVRSTQLEAIRNMSGKISEEIMVAAREMMGVSDEDTGENGKGVSGTDTDNQIPEQQGEPGSGPGEPGVGPGEPGVGPGEPGEGPGEPGSGPGGPGAGPGEPGDGPGEPGSGPGGPGSGLP